MTTAQARMLQDDSRELSKALAEAPHARRHAFEAAAAIAATNCADPREGMDLAQWVDWPNASLTGAPR